MATTYSIACPTLYTYSLTFFSSIRRPPTSTLSPYTTLFRSGRAWCASRHHSISASTKSSARVVAIERPHRRRHLPPARRELRRREQRDRKSTRLNSSHMSISYAVFCLKKKNCVRHHGDDVFHCLPDLIHLLSHFFFKHTAPTDIYTLSLHDALPIWSSVVRITAS